MVNVQDYNAPNLGLPTNLRALLRTNDLLWGTWCHIAYEEVARVLALLPHEFCFIDGEHTPMGPKELTAVTRAINFYSGGSMIPLVRGTTPDMVNHALNAGAGGVVMPHIRTKAEAEALVRLVRFPPDGDRSVPPNALLGRQNNLPNGLSAINIWNDHVAVFAQVEDVQAVENIEEIARVPGLDGIMVGGWDLQSSMKLSPSRAGNHHPEFLAAIEKIQRAADANGLAVMGAATPDTLADRIKLGWKLIITSPDAAGILNWGMQRLEECKKIAGEVSRPGKNAAQEDQG